MLLVVLMDLGVVPYDIWFLQSQLWGKYKTWNPWFEGVGSGFHRYIVIISNEMKQLCCEKYEKCYGKKVKRANNIS